MKRILTVLIPAVVLAAAAGWYWSGDGNPTTPPQPPAAPRPGPPPTKTLTDPAAIFNKAFWRQPSGEDRIIHAERNEWSDAEGLTRWEWFIGVKASPELLRYLREENAFGLSPAPAAVLPEGRPAWFTFDPAAVTVMASRRGKLQLIFDNGSNQLFASDSGNGFQRGAAAPVPAVVNPSPGPAPVSGRLPTTPPPIPSK